MDKVASVRTAAVVAALACSFAVSASGASELLATKLHAESVTGHAVVLQGSTLLDYWASGPVAGRLTSDGASLEGKAVRFSVDGTEICVDVTSASGYAGCTMEQTLAAAALIVAADGYEASFAGDDTYGPSSAAGPLTDINGGP
jgi:hypothetical protein